MTAQTTTTIAPPVSPTLEKLIASREAEAIEQYRLSKITRENALFAAADAEIEHGNAEAAFEDIEDSFSALSEEFTAADHAEAFSALRRAELRLTGAQAKARQAEKAVVSVDKLAAEVLAQVVRAALPGATVVTTFRDVGNNKPAQEELPLALVIQSDATALNKDGSISSTGVVKVRWYRGALYTSLSADRLEKAAAGISVGMEIVGNVSSSHHGALEEIRVKLHSGLAGLPFLAKIDPWSLRNVGATVTADIAAACRYHDETPSASRIDGAHRTSFVTVLNHEASVVSNDVDDLGERLLVLDLSVLVETHKEKQGRTSSEEIDAILKTLGDGAFFPGVGLCERLDRVSPEETTVPVEDREVRTLLAMSNDGPVDAHKVGYEATHAHYLRATLRSTTVTPVV
ncbi:hypothetical protein [Nocardioides baculatus]|uniref:Uncharacterized protein n=1 Tax=Nocardioides baculatus TaxID=2801337 RepID=A0ABS1LDM0_9ACTN|nr:hypothetical protein [Nocardioides baculatus]MBL0749791.1 hypothetical protein [Nocardioides baculatus]